MKKGGSNSEVGWMQKNVILMMKFAHENKVIRQIHDDADDADEL